jgi:hypothetical protein
MEGKFYSTEQNGSSECRHYVELEVDMNVSLLISSGLSLRDIRFIRVVGTSKCHVSTLTYTKVLNLVNL